jgi:hypothetical protein
MLEGSRRALYRGGLCPNAKSAVTRTSLASWVRCHADAGHKRQPWALHFKGRRWLLAAITLFKDMPLAIMEILFFNRPLTGSYSSCGRRLCNNVRVDRFA